MCHAPAPGWSRARVGGQKWGTISLMGLTWVSMQPARAWASPGLRESVPWGRVELGRQNEGNFYNSQRDGQGVQKCVELRNE